MILIGDADKINALASKNGVNLTGVKIDDPAKSERLEKYISTYHKLREAKGMTAEEAKKLISEDYAFYGAMMVRFGDADGMVAGAANATATIIQVSVLAIGFQKGISTPSSPTSARERCFRSILSTIIRTTPRRKDLSAPRAGS